MVNEDAPDLETLVEDSRNPHAVRQYIAMGDRIAALEAQLAEAEQRYQQTLVANADLFVELREAEELAVFAVLNAYQMHDRALVSYRERVGIKTNGTPADILRALRKAKGGE